MKRGIVTLLVVGTVLGLIGCSFLPLDMLDDPADPEAASYQGFHLTDDPDKIVLSIPNDTRIAEPILIFSKVIGAEKYQVQVASDPWFSDSDSRIDEDTFTNIVEVTLKEKTHHVRYWRVRAFFDGKWRAWSETGTFIYLHPLTVYFDAQGGIGIPIDKENMTVTYNHYYGDLPEDLSKDDLAFDGWWTEPGGKGERVEWATTVLTEEGHILYAKWRKVVFAVGDIGPAGGYVFYDKGSYSSGWQYLEAAPAGWSGASEDPKYVFGYQREGPTDDNQWVYTYTSIGDGRANTVALVNAMGDQAYVSPRGKTKAAYAAKVAADYSTTVEGDVYDDWFLPSWEELYTMYTNLKLENLGGFSDSYYWASTAYYDIGGWVQGFHDASYGYILRDRVLAVRPIRAF